MLLLIDTGVGAVALDTGVVVVIDAAAAAEVQGDQ